MNFYVALGGIACRVLKEYSKRSTGCAFYYLDTDPGTASYLDRSDRFYCVQGLPYGTGAYRQIGKNATKCDIYSGKLASFFESIHRSASADITILTSSFGGFGSGAAIEILDYLEYAAYHRRSGNQEKHCRLIALSEAAMALLGMPKETMETYKANTLEMLGEIASRKVNHPSMEITGHDQRLFHPACRFFLVDAGENERDKICAYLKMDDEELQLADVQQRYALKGKKSAPPVFISYSSKDQATADLLVSALEQRNISSWIATKSINEGGYAEQIIQGIRNAKVFVVLLSKNSIASNQVKNEIDRAFARLDYGLKMVPFFIDDSELDDACTYYLCRQEHYFGKEPPITERIRELVDKISNMLE